LTTLLYLSEGKLDRVAWRLLGGTRFTTVIPERTLFLPRVWQLCLLTADGPLEWEGDERIPNASRKVVRTIIGLARIRSSPRPTTTDDRIVVDETHVVEGGVTCRELIAVLPRKSRAEARKATKKVAARLESPLSEQMIEGLIGIRPELRQVVRHLARNTGEDEPVEGSAGEILVLERDAAHLALSIAGIDPGPLQEWAGIDTEGFLASLAPRVYEAHEDALLHHDSTRLPDWQLLLGERPDWLTFTNGREHIRVGNVNLTPLENTLGVDLIYRHMEADTFVLVQYKRMKRDSRGEWFYRPDDQLEVEMDRMRRLDLISDTKPPVVNTWRLHPHGCFVKLVRQPEEFDPTSDRLIPGIYLPLSYLDELLADECTLTERGAHKLGYDTIDRYITSGLFVSLLRQGWVGTRGVATEAVAALVNVATGAGRSVILAEEWGKPVGRHRRNRVGG